MKIGFWISDKKWKKLNVSLLEKLLSGQGHEMVRLDVEQSLEQQGPFGAIVHKVSDEIAKADQGDLSAQRRIRAFEVISDFLCSKEHPADKLLIRRTTSTAIRRSPSLIQ